jgi:hypothetical protein
MNILNKSTTSFFHKVQSQKDPNALPFILAADSDARGRAAKGGIIIGIARARGIPARMPCCLDHGLIPADAIIVMLDMALSTWGGALKAVGNVSLFRGLLAQDFWSLAAHVDAFGLKHLTSWRCQADRSGSNGGKQQTAEAMNRYRAMVVWWKENQPVWNGQGELPVTEKIMVLAHTLTVLLGNESDLRAYAAMVIEKNVPTNNSVFFERELFRKIEQLKQECQALLARAREFTLPEQQPETTKFFVKKVEERAQGSQGNTTRFYRRSINGPLLDDTK